MFGKLIISILAVLLLAQLANAEDALVTGGKSQDGRYEIRVYAIPGHDPMYDCVDYSYELFDVMNGKVLKRFRAGGTFADYNGAVTISKVMWSPSGKFFALIDHGGRHNMDLYLYRVTRSSVIPLRIPDYLHRALNLVGADEIFRASAVEPIRWDGNAFISTYYFDAQKDSTISGPFTTQLTLTVPEAGGVDVKLTAMDKPESNPND